MVNVNHFNGNNDAEVINEAIKNRDKDGIVIIPPRKSARESERDWWSLDSAILLPENTTVILQNCKIKLSDKCRDNFFRTANCGMGIEMPEKIQNVHIKGVGRCVLEGADHPRATGDGSKIISCPAPYNAEDLCRLADWIPDERREPDKVDFWDWHGHSYGTDAGKEGESQYGDWRGIGVLFANTENFSISNLHIAYSHGWGISLEACTNGRVEKIDFYARMYKEIDGLLQNLENQDGIDIRNGCHNIFISDITGVTGDDVIALTAIAAGGDYRPGGSLKSTHVMHNDWSKRDRNISNITIRNVTAFSHYCYIIRLLAAGCTVKNVVIDGVIDTADDEARSLVGINLGCNEYGAAGVDSISNVTISNVICKSHDTIAVGGYVRDVMVNNVINTAENGNIIAEWPGSGVKNLVMNNVSVREEK